MSPENDRLFHIAGYWSALDDLELSAQVTDLQVPKSRAEGFLMRLALAAGFHREQARKEWKRGR